jgi:outer membrane protein OmpA-like peptidoglycan-associated protein
MSRNLTSFVAASALFAGTAAAQDIQNFKPAGGTWNYFSVEGARVIRHEHVIVPSLVINYGHNPLVTRKGGEVDDTVVANLTTADIMLTTGFLDHFELTLDLPVSHATGDLLKQGGNDGFGLGDVRLVPKIRLFGLEKDHGFGIAIAVPLNFPTGDADKFIGADQFTLNPKLILEARASGLSFAANGGVKVRPDKQAVAGTTLELGTEVTYGAGIGIDLGSDDALLLAELFGATPVADVSNDAKANPLEALAGFRFFTDPGAVFTIAGGTGIVPDYGSPTYRVIFGFAWHDRNYDADNDGLLDDQDKCPEDPEDRDGFEDTDGCPDVDNDKDGVNDAVQSAHADEDGIHGYEAGPDRCPLVPEDKDAFQDEDGCPEEDNDQDKILDVDDKCPNEPETLNNFQDTDGCPDTIPDTDKDGLLDPQDKCPTDPEDMDGFEDTDGCPEPDNDRDGIPDVSDRCPNEPEVVNGVDDTDGCPDQGLVKLTTTKIEILEKVFFDTAKATIKPQSFELLNQVAFVIKSNKRIKGIRVEGHTDNRGSKKYNMKLSQARADSVLRYLVGQGVDAGALEAVGYGPDVPVQDNRTEAGRDANRRVEFVITKQE